MKDHVSSDEIISPRHERALAIARAAGADAVLAAHPGTVTWLTGYAPEAEGRPNPFGLAPLALLAPDEPPVLVLGGEEPDPVGELSCRVVHYDAVAHGELRPAERATAALRDVVAARTVATEGGHLPAALGQAISWVDAGFELAGARAVKDPDEIDRLRRSIAVCDAGQRAAREQARSGMTELELWALVRAAMEHEAGQRVPAVADVVSGPRSARIGGPPTPRVMRAGELLLVDLVPCVEGYWGDSCATLAVEGGASTEARGLWWRAHDALERLIDAVRPGIPAAALDALARQDLGYPHHTGHGIGTLMHEGPRIAPGSDAVLEPGMVLALEPGIYAEEGVRVERVVLVTEDGREVLSRHELGLDPGA